MVDRRRIRLNDIVFTEKEVKYHGCCSVKYQTTAEASINMEREVLKRSGYWYVNRDVHSKAFEALTCYLKDTVVNDTEVLLLADLNRYYTHLLHEFDGENFIDASSSSQKLE